MNGDFYYGEKLYRAIRPIEPFMREDGTISSGAFTDSNGLSVDKQMHRENETAIKFMKSQKSGLIVSVTSNDCTDKGIYCVYLPFKGNVYHSELHKNKETRKLTRSQAKHLANSCKRESS